MNTSTRSLILTALTACAPGLACVEAAPVTDTYDFLASGFGAGAPQDPVSGSFTLTFDPAVPLSGAAVDAISLDIAGQQYTTANTAFGFNGLDLFLGGTLNGTAVLAGTNDFFFEGVVNAQGLFTDSLSFVYSTAATDTTFAAGQVTASTPIPEPPIWTLAAVAVLLALSAQAAIRPRSFPRALDSI